MDPDQPCTKHRFATRSEAKRFATKRRGRYGRQRAYLCRNPECEPQGIWHLTSIPTGRVTYYRDREDRARRKRAQP